MTITLTREEAQQVLDALDSCEWYDDGGFGCPSYDYDKVFPARETIRARLAQPERASCDGGTCGLGGYCDKCPKAQPEPKPVAWMRKDEDCADCITWHRTEENTIPLYTAPPQREWQGLTDEEIGFAWENTPVMNLAFAAFARAIEAKLKEKNNG